MNIEPLHGVGGALRRGTRAVHRSRRLQAAWPTSLTHEPCRRSVSATSRRRSHSWTGLRRLFTDSGNLLRVVTPRSSCGHGLWGSRDGPTRGFAHTSAALKLTRNLGYAEGEAHGAVAARGGPGWLRTPGGGGRGSLQGVDLAKRIGHRGWTACTLRALGVARAGGRRGPVRCRRRARRERAARAASTCPCSRPGHRANLAVCRLAQGRVDEAADHVSAALGTAPGDRPVRRPARSVREWQSHVVTPTPSSWWTRHCNWPGPAGTCYRQRDSKSCAVTDRSLIPDFRADLKEIRPAS